MKLQDFNAEVGSGEAGNVVGNFELGVEVNFSQKIATAKLSGAQR